MGGQTKTVITMKSFLCAHSGRYGWTDQTMITMKSFLYVQPGEVWVDRPDCDHHEIIPVCTIGRDVNGYARL